MGRLAGGAIVLTSGASYLMTTRLFRSAESGLATLRTKAFRHVHDLPLLPQNTARRASLASRGTGHVHTVSQLLVFGGVMMLVSIGQLLLATAWTGYSQCTPTIEVWVGFRPLVP